MVETISNHVINM